MQTEYTAELIARFWSKVAKSEDPDGCWLWTAACFTDGYGVFQVNGRARRAHRFAWELTVGPIPDSLFACHRCDTRKCCRPDHLWLGTQADNMRDRDTKGRVASGDRHGSHTRPDRWARGERSGAFLHPERYRLGDRHWTRSHPERLATGADHWTHRMPDRLARGDRNGARTHPESRRGDQNGNAKLTAVIILEIRRRWADERPSQSALAIAYGVTQATISAIVLRRSWKHL